MANKEVNITNSVNIYLLSFLLSASLKDIRPYKGITITMYCLISNIYTHNMYSSNGTKQREGVGLYRNKVFISYWDQISVSEVDYKL